MTFVFHIMIVVIFVTLQTTFFPAFRFFDGFFDLYLPLIIYMGLFRSLRESILLLLVMGLVMDGMSGAPFGIYLSCYVWLFTVVYWFKGFLHIHSFPLLALIVVLGVLLENTMLVLFSDGDLSQPYFFSQMTRMLLFQLISAVLIGPFVILWIRTAFEKMRTSLNRRSDHL